MNDSLKFLGSDFTDQDISSLSDTPNVGVNALDATGLKARFDNIGKNMIALGKHNDLVDALTASTAAAGIGAVDADGNDSTVQDLLGNMSDASGIVAYDHDLVPTTVQAVLDLLADADNSFVDVLYFTKSQNLNPPIQDIISGQSVEYSLQWLANEVDAALFDAVNGILLPNDDGSSSVTAQNTVKATVQAFINHLSNRISTRLSEITALQSGKVSVSNLADTTGAAMVGTVAPAEDASADTAQEYLDYLNENKAPKYDIAPEFDDSSDWYAGQYIYYNGTLYRFLNDHTGAWDASDVEEWPLGAVGNADGIAARWPDDTIASVQDVLNGTIDAVVSIFNDFAEPFDGTASYSVGDYVIYAGGLYRFTSAHTGAWDADDATEVSVTGEIKDLQGEVADLKKTMDTEENTSASLTLDATSPGKFYVMDTETTTVTIPAGATIPVGSKIQFFRNSALAVQFSAAAGVTLKSVGGAPYLKQFGVATLVKYDDDAWVLYGDISN